MKKNNKKNYLKDKLTFKYRFVVLNEDTFEERFSFKLNRLNAFVFGGLFSIILIVLTILLILFTPLKEYIQGYSSVELQNSVLKQLQIDKIDFAPSSIDSAFREEVEQQDRFSVFDQATKSDDIVFTSPVKGDITENYNTEEKHFAIDIAVDKDTPVKAVADGAVVFSGFTSDTGYVIVLEHSQGFISVYKHNASIYKNQGELVRSGEVIASAGSTGTFSTGPHLHFELWNDGYPVNPSNYISFE
jgi:murein DD-endopeptidase MepM/ murein hydrolase activator NlpD